MSEVKKKRGRRSRKTYRSVERQAGLTELGNSGSRATALPATKYTRVTDQSQRS